MKNKIAQLLAQKGQSAVYNAIDNTIRDLKSAQYDQGEIKETLRDYFFGIDGKVDKYIISKGY